MSEDCEGRRAVRSRHTKVILYRGTYSEVQLGGKMSVYIVGRIVSVILKRGRSLVSSVFEKGFQVLCVSLERVHVWRICGGTNIVGIEFIT